jgi:hypothetical protein
MMKWPFNPRGELLQYGAEPKVAGTEDGIYQNMNND